MTETLRPERHSWLKFSLLMLFLSGYFALNYFSGDSEMNINLDDSKVVNMLKVAQAVLVVILFIVPSVLFSVFWTNENIHYIGMTKKPAFSTLLIAGIGMLMAVPLINWLGEVNKGMQLPEALHGMEAWMKSSEEKAAQFTEAFTRGTSVGVLFANLFVVAFMAALSEEIFFRGIIQKVSIECFKNKHVGVWFAAIIFSAFHMQFYGFLPRMLMGAYLGYLFLWSGSLWPGILAHFLNNGMAVFLVWLVNRGTITDSGEEFGIEEGQMVYLITSALIVIMSLFLVYRIEGRRKTS
jgi:uncharacterized protein